MSTADEDRFQEIADGLVDAFPTQLRTMPGPMHALLVSDSPDGTAFAMQVMDRDDIFGAFMRLGLGGDAVASVRAAFAECPPENVPVVVMIRSGAIFCCEVPIDAIGERAPS